MSPWDAYWEALADLECAERFGTEEQVAAAREAAEVARDRCRLLGLFLFTLASEHDEFFRQIHKVANELVEESWRRSNQAHTLAAWAAERIDALEQRIKELSNKVNDLEADRATGLACEGDCRRVDQGRSNRQNPGGR